MKALYELKEKFEMELEELARKGELGAGDLELAHKLTDTIKNIDKICALEEDGGYSGDSYSRGSSYRRRHYVRGHYSRDGYSNDRGGYSRDGGYSRHDAVEAMMEQARDMMESATNGREREAIRRFMTELERD
ncbi:hypothetical protein [Flavonifractor plautii]|jgi:hypothetical protein|uniref:hypothetical protein n=1 Tax=Flavonifractor plautii TaxID=292800 RepID=UPI0018AC243F|nr:hypothetical protein [Flavonifractor plautii]